MFRAGLGGISLAKEGTGGVNTPVCRWILSVDVLIENTTQEKDPGSGKFYTEED